MRILVFLFLLVVSCRATDLSPVVWTNSVGTEVYVASYWYQQFPDRSDSEGRNLIFLVTKSKWRAYTEAQRNQVRTKLTALLAGELRLSLAKLQEWEQSSALDLEIVGPSGNPSGGNKLYFVICGKNERPYSRVASFGIYPIPEID